MKKTYDKDFSRKKIFLRVMKIYTVIFFVTMVNLFALDMNGQNITMNLKDAELKSAFKEIESKTNFNFFYNNALVDVNKKISINVKNQNLDRVLHKLFKNTPIDFKMVKSQIVLFPKNNSSILAMIEKILLTDEEKS